MGGSGGGGPFRYQSPEAPRNRVREAEEKAKDAAFEAALSGTLGELLRDYCDGPGSLDSFRGGIS